MVAMVLPGDLRTRLNEVLQQLLAQGVVDALYVPLRTARGDTVVPALVSHVEYLADADPLTPMMLINGARAVAAVSLGAGAGKVGAVLRSCEIRALIELAKLRQADLEHVMIVGIDCVGTYEATDYVKLRAAQAGPTGAVLAGARTGHVVPQEGYTLRPACQMCEYPVPDNAEIRLGYISVDGLLMEMDEAIADKLVLPCALSLSLGEGGVGTGGDADPHPSPLPGSEREEAVHRLVAERTARRDDTMATFRARMTTATALADYFAACQRCHNCMVACPICYCKECLFRTGAVEHDPARHLRQSTRKGAARLPADTILFHLTRLNHMTMSCVGCGMCESACPSHIPLTVLFRTVAARTQALFGYVPGRRLDEEIPLMTFREAELQEVK